MRFLQNHVVALIIACVCGLFSSAESAEKSFPLTAKKILFLGDSNTNAGEFIALIETQLRLQAVSPLPEIINLGLSSETCSGLSEPDHPFPRPNVHERLGRALDKIKPDLVVACYGMNDAIYHPFSDARFEIFQKGIGQLIEKVHASGARMVLLTPPPFDPLVLKSQGKLLPDGQEKYAWFAPYANYDDVISRYAKWIMEQQDRVDMIVDLHGPLTEYVIQQRKVKPDYSIAPDGVHFTGDGHRIVAKTILKAWGVEMVSTSDAELQRLVSSRSGILHDAWLSHIGHLRPGVNPGLPLPEALKQASELDQKIQQLLQKNK